MGGDQSYEPQPFVFQVSLVVVRLSYLQTPQAYLHRSREIEATDVLKIVRSVLRSSGLKPGRQQLAFFHFFGEHGEML